MLRPAAIQILKNNESYYSLVVAVAKRARQITEEAAENKTVLNERPVKKAVDEFASGEYKLIESPELRG
ncbi:MAG: DNA-directed RNA polymerase subunit omega [Ruminococcus sp.]|nr:DNA-directed RNA polymerase subunit omega [Ruminococcus sp.]